MHLTRREDIGLFVGKYLRPSALGETGQALLFCASLRQAIGLQAKYLHLTQQAGQLKLRLYGDIAHILWTSAFDSPTYTRPLAEAVLMNQTHIARWLSWNSGTLIKAVHFRHSKPSYAQRYQDYFKCPIVFNQEHNAILIDAAILDTALPQANADILSDIRKRLDWAMVDLIQMEPAHIFVRQYFEHMLEKSHISMKHLSGLMGMSERSLRRRLTLEGTDYSQLLTEVRQHLCLQYLEHGRFNLNTIATKLGYSEQSAFNRAFKKWHGISPTAFTRLRLV